MSTEFTVGLEGGRNSSKVLKPPGGGSSDIFGIGSSVDQTKGPSSVTKNRIFGSEQTQTYATPKKEQGTVLQNDSPLVRSTKKAYVPRNPITGEGMGFDANENSEKENQNGDECEKAETKIENEVKTESVVEGITGGETRPKAVPSIRVRHPPGGTSSIIF